VCDVVGVNGTGQDEYKLSIIGGERPRKKKKEDQDSDNSDNEWADLEIGMLSDHTRSIAGAVRRGADVPRPDPVT
jgi:hypothetical protein